MQNRWIPLIFFFIAINSLLLVGMATVGWQKFAMINNNQAAAHIDNQPNSSDVSTSGIPATNSTNTVADQLQATQIDALSSRIESLEQNITQLQKASPSASVTTTKIVTAPPTPKEHLVFLGSGSTNNRDWTDITSASVTLDSNQYGNIREVRFEAGLSIINGEAHARLYDQTTKTPFYITEVYNNTSAGQWQTSAKTTLPPGNHVYSVQLKSTSGEMANLVGARIKIISD